MVSKSIGDSLISAYLSSPPQQIDLYHNRLSEVITTLTDIHKSYVSESSPTQVNLQSSVIAQLNADMRAMVSKTLPAMEALFMAAQASVQDLIYADVYPGFVRHQLALSASRALAEDKSRYQGLGDCFCLTDPGYVSLLPFAYLSSPHPQRCNASPQRQPCPAQKPFPTGHSVLCFLMSPSVQTYRSVAQGHGY